MRRYRYFLLSIAGYFLSILQIGCCNAADAACSGQARVQAKALSEKNNRILIFLLSKNAARFKKGCTTAKSGDGRQVLLLHKLGGEVTEWLKVHAWNACVRKYREFESHPLRQITYLTHVLIAGSCATKNRELRQVRKEAAAAKFFMCCRVARLSFLCPLQRCS